MVEKDYLEPIIPADTMNVSTVSQILTLTGQDDLAPGIIVETALSCHRNTVRLFVWGGSVREKTIFVAGLRHPRLQLLRAIPVTINVDPEGVTAWSHDLEEYGTGGDEAEALRDLLAAISGLYFTLKQHKGELGPRPAEQWQFLNQVIREV